MSTPKKRIGILGSGQLGQMLKTSGDPFANISLYTGQLSDEASLSDFSQTQDLLLIENEFLNPELLPAEKLIPSARSIALSQNKWTQKALFQKHDIPSPSFHAIRDIKEIETPGVLKASRGGYDGKGTFFVTEAMLAAQAPELENFVEQNLPYGLYLEERIQFKKELAQVFCQTENELFAYPLVETVQKQGTCEWVKSFEALPELTASALKIGQEISKIFEFRGVFAVEFFLDQNDELLVNEIAPRVHNSGHFTMDACPVSQFEAHILTALGSPLKAADFLAKTPFVMMNFLGTAPFEPPHHSIKIYDYGKSEVRPMRKMGHANFVDTHATSADQIMKTMKRAFKT